MKKCPNCGQVCEDSVQECKNCGGWIKDDAGSPQPQAPTPSPPNMPNQPLPDRPTPEEVETDLGSENTKYFGLHPKKLVVLSILTLGIYELYWFYRNWKCVKEQENLNIVPWARGVFNYIFCYHLFKRILESAKTKGLETKHKAGALTTLYILLGVIGGKAPDPFWLIALLSFWILLPVQKSINYINAKMGCLAHEEKAWTKGEKIVFFVGLLFWILMLLGWFVPEPV